jgi:hypothetical protein
MIYEKMWMTCKEIPVAILALVILHANRRAPKNLFQELAFALQKDKLG